MTDLRTNYIDAAFPLRGQSIPIDHGYSLFAALSRIVPALHESRHWGVHPVRGEYQGKGVLALTEHSHIKIRLPAGEIAAILALTGQPIDIDGNACKLGVPTIFQLIPAPYLQSRLVTIKSASTEEEIARSVSRQLAELPELGQPADSVEVEIGPRRVLRIKGKSVWGYAVALSGLLATGSVAVQQNGLGGRRRMGAGMFVPPARRA